MYGVSFQAISLRHSCVTQASTPMGQTKKSYVAVNLPSELTPKLIRLSKHPMSLYNALN